MKKKLLAAGCLLLALAAMSCGNEANPSPAQSGTEEDSGVPSAPVTEEPATESSVVYDIPEPELPELDLTGQTFTYYCQSFNNTVSDVSGDARFVDRDFLYSDSLIGEVVNDAVFNRNLQIEQKFGCSIQLMFRDTSPDVLVMGGDNSFDIICTSSTILGDTMGSGAYLDFTDVPYLSLESEYWSPFCVRDTIFRGRLYMMPNDTCLMPLANTGFLYFNKRILSEYDIENPYDLVHNNTWTIDNWLNMIKQVHADLNGDGVMDMEDLYGALVMAHFRMNCYVQFYFGSGRTLTKEDPDAGRVIDVDGEFAQSLIDMLRPVLEDKTICMDWNDIRKITGGPEPYEVMFMEGHCMFIQADIGSMDKFREMPDDFGIVPNPKYDSSQESFYHRVSSSVSMFAIPATVTDFEKLGAVTEYTAWLSHYTVLPAYYEITVKQKRTRDEDAIEMLDIIRKTMVFEFGDVYDSWIPNYLYDSYLEGSYARKMGANIKVLNKRLVKYTKMLDGLAQ